jgi:Zn-dependent protease
MNLDAEAIRLILLGMITLILSIAVHEFGHAIVAHKLGDYLPKSQGRVTLNPIAHADPIGTLAFPLMFLLMTGGHSIGFGWGKPVMVNPMSFTRKLRMRTAHLLVAAAGPAMNLLLAAVLVGVHFALLETGTIDRTSQFNLFLLNAVGLNVILLFFNLIPAPPLDGGTVLEGLLPDRWIPAFQRYAVYGPFVLMAVIFIPQLRWVFVTPALWLANQLYGLAGLGAPFGI